MLDAIVNLVLGGAFLCFLFGVLPMALFTIVFEIPQLLNDHVATYFGQKTEQINEWTEKKQRENQRSS